MPRAKTPRNGNAKNVTPITQGVVSDTKTKKKTPPLSLEEEIRIRAFELYADRGFTPGDEKQDWLVAEREVLARHKPQSAPSRSLA